MRSGQVKVGGEAKLVESDVSLRKSGFAKQNAENQVRLGSSLNAMQANSIQWLQVFAFPH